jgi:hypothetical protein
MKWMEKMANKEFNHNLVKDVIAFRGSITNSVFVRSDQVRNLIGSSHWYSDGAYKEQLIREAIRTELPSRYSVSHGFIIGPGTEENESSNQLDAFVHDTSEFPPVLTDGDFAIALAGNASAVIEIKSCLDYSGEELKSASDLLVRAFDLRENSRHKTNSKNLFTGIVAFKFDLYPQKDGKPDSNSRVRVAQKLIENYSERANKQYFELKDLTHASAKSLPPLIPQYIISLSNCDWLIYLGWAHETYQDVPYVCPVVHFLKTIQNDKNDTPQNHSLHILTSAILYHCSKERNHVSFDGQREVNLDHYMKIFSGKYDELEPPISLVATNDKSLKDAFNKIDFAE